jgi:hypothetical protein
MLRAACIAATAIASNAAPLAAKNGEGMERIYFQSWNVGNECSSTPSCREAATAYLANGTGSNPMAFEPSEIAVFGTIGLLAADSTAVDLTQYGYLKGKGYTQVDGLCHAGHKLGNDAASLTFRPGFTVVKKGGGCLSKGGLLGTSKPHAFAVALVKPPKVNKINKINKYLGGIVKNCQEGVCMVAVNVPVDGVAQGADKIAAVCGDARHHCTVGLGDFAGSGGITSIGYHWKQLIGDTGSQKVFVTGPDRANLVSNIPGVGRGMNIGQGFPLAKQFGNGTAGGTVSQAELMDQLLPCQFPGAFIYDGCTK